MPEAQDHKDKEQLNREGLHKEAQRDVDMTNTLVLMTGIEDATDRVAVLATHPLHDVDPLDLSGQEVILNEIEGALGYEGKDYDIVFITDIGSSRPALTEGENEIALQYVTVID